jgi:precorrin-6B C5,15-methyltransferase / cobalt-precorrin-6B C5,C15-methyltransferase
VFEQLGGGDEASYTTTAEHFEPRHFISPYLVAIDVRAELDLVPLALVPGLPDDAYDHDGQLTKREVRAITVAMLAPLPGEFLWDVGAGAGSVAIEWLRAEPSARAVAIEVNTERAKRIEKNALALGVPRLEVCDGSAPEVFGDLDTPDAVFIGGGLTTPGLLHACWDRLKPAGRISANAVTLEGERVLFDASKEHGGTVVRIEIGRAEPIGTLTGWRTQFPIVQWNARKESQ